MTSVMTEIGAARAAAIQTTGSFPERVTLNDEAVRAIAHEFHAATLLAHPRNWGAIVTKDVEEFIRKARLGQLTLFGMLCAVDERAPELFRVS
jgi:hypothetical protein